MLYPLTSTTFTYCMRHDAKVTKATESPNRHKHQYTPWPHRQKCSFGNLLTHYLNWVELVRRKINRFNSTLNIIHK